MAHTQGYPSDANVAAYILAEIVEIVEAGKGTTVSYIPQFNHILWNILKQSESPRVLAVVAPTTNDINVNGGEYLWNGTRKTYTAGADIDLSAGYTSDTVYVWMQGDNTVGYGTDAVGWPVETHLKLATVDVSATDLITDIDDMRPIVAGAPASADYSDILCVDDAVVCLDDNVVTV